MIGTLLDTVPDLHTRLVAYVTRFVGRQDAEDLVQDAYLKTLHTTHGYDGRNGCHEVSWLFTVARNTAISHLRSQRRRPHAQPLEVVTAADPQTSNLDLRVYVSEMLSLFDDLDPVQVESLRAIVAYGTYEDAAAALGIPDGTLKSRAHRGRQALRSRL